MSQAQLVRTTIFAMFLSTSTALALPLDTVFPYQGRLQLNGAPHNGDAWFWFQMYDQPGTGNLIGEVFTNAVPVSDGLFRVDLDFGLNAFDGSGRWLDIYVQTTGDLDWTLLGPPVPVAAVPYALHALNGGNGGAGPWQANGNDLTYSAGGVGVLGYSTPWIAGKGVFMEGGIDTHANIFAFDYDLGTPIPLVLNIPGGNVGIGTSTPSAKLHVSAGLNGTAVLAENTTSGGATVQATNAWPGGIAIQGNSIDGRGVAGWSTNAGWGVTGDNITSGTWGILGTPFEGVAGFSPNPSIPAGRFTNGATGGLGLDVVGTARVKTLTITGGADLAERFEAGPADPGTVMAIDPDAPGRLEVSDESYCRRVAGVVSGANSLAAGVVLGEGDAPDGELPIALSGRVWVKCDASLHPIEAGDLLTTSQRSGHAMVARDPSRTPGAVLGKAMSSLESGTGLVLVLVTLQ